MASPCTCVSPGLVTGLRSRGRGVTPRSSAAGLHGFSHTALALRLRVDQENWPPLRGAPFSLPGPFSALVVGGMPARQTPINRHPEHCTTHPSHSLPTEWDIHQWLQGERPWMFAGVCYRSPKRRTKLKQDNTSNLKGNIFSSTNYFPCYSWR